MWRQHNNSHQRLFQFHNRWWFWPPETEFSALSESTASTFSLTRTHTWGVVSVCVMHEVIAVVMVVVGSAALLRTKSCQTKWFCFTDDPQPDPFQPGGTGRTGGVGLDSCNGGLCSPTCGFTPACCRLIFVNFCFLAPRQTYLAAGIRAITSSCIQRS